MRYVEGIVDRDVGRLENQLSLLRLYFDSNIVRIDGTLVHIEQGYVVIKDLVKQNDEFR